MDPSSSEFDDSLISLLRVTMLPGIGPRTLTSLLERFESAENLLAASRQDLMTVDGVGPKLATTICDAETRVSTERVLQVCRLHKIDILHQQSETYPQHLLELCDAPPILFKQGELHPQDELAVAIVGTRRPTAYGKRQTERISAGLANAGVTVISGLARGIDGIAHRAALEAGGRTIAVLGNGLASIYPQEHTKLADEVVESGALLSEYPPEAAPHAGAFPQRNRLISALSIGVCVIEAGDRSGASITARLAGEQGRDCYALPGPVTSAASAGTNRLIRDGATLIRSADDILECLGPLAKPVRVDAGGEDSREMRNPAELKLNDIELAILDAIGTESTSIDNVAAASNIPIHRVLSTISVLEMRRLIRRLSGQYVVRI